MPLTAVHFNGGVNLADGETVMREIGRRVPRGPRRIPDGETGDRQQWIFFQFGKFTGTPGLEPAGTKDEPAEGYEQMPKLRLAEGVAPGDVRWPELGYADAYVQSFQTFRRLQDEGVLPTATRFQVEYPTPLASINAWIVLEEQDALIGSYTEALFADLDNLLAQLPHDKIAVQWDVAVEFAILEGGFDATESQTFAAIVQSLADCVDRVPADVPVGLHLCYGDYGHRHFKEPDSLDLQVRVANEIAEKATRPIGFVAFTVPQSQQDTDFFSPLRKLSLAPETELYFGIVPYHPATQEAGTTEAQVGLVDQYLGGNREWGICTECGMARAEREDVPVLLDLHREILNAYGA